MKLSWVGAVHCFRNAATGKPSAVAVSGQGLRQQLSHVYQRRASALILVWWHLRVVPGCPGCHRKSIINKFNKLKSPSSQC